MRKAVDGAQAGAPMPDVEDASITVPADVGDVRVSIMRPSGATGQLPTVLYMHGGGWILGSVHSHGRLAGELAVAADAAVVFIDYALAPEARYPVQLEQCYAVARWVCEQGDGHGLDPSRIAVAGDSAGGNMATVLCIMAKQRGDMTFVQQSMLPDGGRADQPRRRAIGCSRTTRTATRERWNGSGAPRSERISPQSTVSPLRAKREELEGCHPLVIVGKTTFSGTKAKRMRQSCAARMCRQRVSISTVRCDFMMLNALRDTNNARSDGLAASALRRAFGADQVSYRDIPNSRWPLALPIARHARGAG